MNANVDFYGILNLLRQLVDGKLCTANEAERIAARIASQTGVFIEISF